MRYELYGMIGKKMPICFFACEAEELEMIARYQKEHKMIKRWVIIDNAPFGGRLNYQQLGYQEYQCKRSVP